MTSQGTTCAAIGAQAEVVLQRSRFLEQWEIIHSIPLVQSSTGSVSTRMEGSRVMLRYLLQEAFVELWV